MKSLGVYYWYVKMPLCAYMELGLKYFSYYVQKYMAHLAACSGHPAGSRWAASGARMSETRLLSFKVPESYIFLPNFYAYPPTHQYINSSIHPSIHPDNPRYIS